MERTLQGKNAAQSISPKNSVPRSARHTHDLVRLCSFVLIVLPLNIQEIRKANGQEFTNFPLNRRGHEELQGCTEGTVFARLSLQKETISNVEKFFRSIEEFLNRRNKSTTVPSLSNARMPVEKTEKQESEHICALLCEKAPKQHIPSRFQNHSAKD